MSLEFDLLARQGGFSMQAAASGIDGVVGVIGRSGAGKTTLLKALAGLLPCTGHVTLDGQALADLPSHQRRVGVVFQDVRLFPHLTVEANLRYGARDGLDDALLDLLELRPLLSRRPTGLSGGEARRVGLARALAARPRVLLLDEPLVGLDPALRAEVLPVLVRGVQEARVPTLWVSHRPEDVLAATDRLLVCEQGRLVADGSPQELLSLPGAPARALGLHNVLAVDHVVDDPARGVTTARWGPRTLTVPAPPAQVLRTGHGRVLVLPHEILLTVDAPGRTSARNVVQGEVDRIVAVGRTRAVHLTFSGHGLVVDVTQEAVEELSLTPGCTAWALMKTSALRWAGA